MNDEPLVVLAEVEDTLIRYPRFKELHEDIKECQELSKVAGEPHCMALEGPTGAGKTTLIVDYAKQFPRYKTPGGVRIPVFYLEVPSPVTVKGLAEKMLEALGDPAAHKGTQTTMDLRLVTFIKECKVELVILDDFQHLIDSEKQKILAKVSNWLKVLIKEAGVPFLVVGIEGGVEIILKANLQISRLFAVREKLEKFEWIISEPQTIQNFADFIQATEEVVGLRLPWRSDTDADLLYRLHYATDGVVANIMHLVRGANRRARKQGADRLEMTFLASVFDKRLKSHLNKSINPFKDQLDKSFVPPLKQPQDQPKAAGKKGRQRKTKAPSASEMLKK